MGNQCNADENYHFHEYFVRIPIFFLVFFLVFELDKFSPGAMFIQSEILAKPHSIRKPYQPIITI